MEQPQPPLTKDEFHRHLAEVRSEWQKNVEGAFTLPTDLKTELLYYLESAVTTISLITATLPKAEGEHHGSLPSDRRKIQEYTAFCLKAARVLAYVINRNAG